MTMLAVAEETGRSAPKAAAMGSSTKKTCLAPARMVASKTMRLSTGAAPQGTHTTTRGLGCQGALRGAALAMNAESMAQATS